MSSESDNYTKFENLVIIVALIIGFIGSIVLYKLDVKPILVSIFLGTGIASLIYRFLGGTSDNSFKLGALKFSGAVAVLIGSAYFINQELAKQEGPGSIESVTIHPDPETWTALNWNGEPIDLRIEETDQIIEKPSESPWKNVPLQIDPSEDKYRVLGADGIELGILENSTLRNANLYSEVEVSKSEFIVTPRLPPYTESFDLDPLPYKLATKRYSGDHSRYEIMNNQDEVVKEGSIYRKQFEIILLGDKNYLIGVVEVNHDFFQEDSMYAKFAFAEILKKVE